MLPALGVSKITYLNLLITYLMHQFIVDEGRIVSDILNRGHQCCVLHLNDLAGTPTA